jgi:outer membrane protein TolC
MKYRSFSRFFLVILLLAAGCAKVGPNFVKPEANVNANWLEAGQYKQISTKPDDYRNWWRSFNDPVLDSLVQKAYRQNLSLQIAGVRVLQTQAQVGVAVGNLYPQTQQLTGTVQKLRFSENNLSSGTGTPVNFWFSTLGVGASWEIDFWGKIRRGIESADAALLASISDYDNALVTLTGDVATAYILLRTLGPLEGRHHFAQGRGAGQNGFRQHRGLHPHPGDPGATDQKPAVSAHGHAAH